MDAFFSLQAIVMCFATVGVVQVVKKVLDRLVTKKRRKASFVLDAGLVGLVLPIAVGIGLCLALPVHPQSVIDYAAKNFEGKEWQVYALWGATIGQLADYVVTKVQRVFKKWSETAEAKAPSGL